MKNIIVELKVVDVDILFKRTFHRVTVKKEDRQVAFNFPSMRRATEFIQSLDFLEDELPIEFDRNEK